MTRNSTCRCVPRSRSSAFALVEVVAVVLIVAAAITLATVGLPDARRRSMASGSVQNLAQLGAGARSFAADSSDAIFSFSWHAGETHQCGDLTFPVPTTDNQAAADQAVCIMRERGNRPDIVQISAWLPYVMYNTLPLLDYLNEDLPSRIAVSPGDRNRLLWQQAVTTVPGNPNEAFFGTSSRPSPPSTDNASKRWPYSSSYEMQPSFYSPDAMVDGVPTISQAGAPTHRNFYSGDARTPLGRRTFSEVRFPSQKAMMYETEDRFFGPRRAFLMYDEARVPVLLADGSAGVRSINQTNGGFDPANPLGSSPTRVAYIPELSWESPTLSGAVVEYVNGHIRWTRSGLLGRDFGGPEVPWSPP